MASGTIKAVLSRGDVANNLTTSTAGMVLDASQGKILSDNTIKKDAVDQTIQNSTSGGATTFRVTSTAATGAQAYVRADSEGGNFQAQKGNSVVELDSNGLNDSGTGYGRIYTTINGSGVKTFQFKQNGDFVDGNGVSLDGLSAQLPLKAFLVTDLYQNTTKANVDTDLRSKIGSNSQYVAFAILYSMTDGTATGWYLIWRNSNMSSTTQFIKLA